MRCVCLEIDLVLAGRTNGFHIASSSSLACCYNDNSVLENHHCALTYDLINKCSLFNHLDKATQQVGRKESCMHLQGGSLPS